MEKKIIIDNVQVEVNTWKAKIILLVVVRQ